jgi:hypothetical protein
VNTGFSKKLMISMIVMGLLIAVGAIGVPKLLGTGSSEKAPLPDDPASADILGEWHSSESGNSISLEILEDGTVKGSVDGNDFTGSWGVKDRYIIYNAKEKEMFYADVDGSTMTLASPQALSGQKWKMSRKL